MIVIVLVVIDVGLLLMAMARFQRSRLFSLTIYPRRLWVGSARQLPLMVGSATPICLVC